jgi:hypothetical protein
MTDPGHGGFLSRKHAFLDMMRRRLGDMDPLFYTLDIPQLFWTGTDLSTFLDNALSQFNGHPPTPTNYDFDLFPDDAVSILIQGGVALAHQQRASNEIPRVINQTDGGASLQISNRPADYRAMWQAEWSGPGGFLDMIKTWKASHRPGPRGLGVERVPFRIARPLSMIPGFQRIFRFGV